MFLVLPIIPSSLFSFFFVFVGSWLDLMEREKRDDILAYSAAEIGVLFTALTITEGSIWGRPTWGVWWTWDARLTTTALMLALYLGYLALRRVAAEVQSRSLRSAIAGVVLVPVVIVDHFAVEWWRTLHQGRSLADLAP